MVPVELTARGRALDPDEVTDWLESWRLMAPRVAQLAGLRASDADFAAMADALDGMRAAVRTPRLFLQWEERFQLALARATGNAVLVRSVRTMLSTIRTGRGFAVYETRADADWATSSLEQVFAAIGTRDPDAIEREIDRHLTFVEEVWANQSGVAPVRRLPDFLLPYEQRRGEGRRPPPKAG